MLIIIIIHTRDCVHAESFFYNRFKRSENLIYAMTHINIECCAFTFWRIPVKRTSILGILIDIIVFGGCVNNNYVQMLCWRFCLCLFVLLFRFSFVTAGVRGTAGRRLVASISVQFSTTCTCTHIHYTAHRLVSD